MLHLIDANVLIDANRDYYPLARVPLYPRLLGDFRGGFSSTASLLVFSHLTSSRMMANSRSRAASFLFTPPVNFGRSGSRDR
jgi:hypothetical protein